MARSNSNSTPSDPFSKINESYPACIMTSLRQNKEFRSIGYKIMRRKIKSEVTPNYSSEIKVATWTLSKRNTGIGPAGIRRIKIGVKKES